LKRILALTVLFATGLLLPGVYHAQASGPIRDRIQTKRAMASDKAVLPTPPPQSPMPTPTAAAEPLLTAGALGEGKLFHRITRMKLAAELRKKGHTVLEAHQLAQTMTDDVINSTLMTMKVPLSAIGDGTILQKIIDFFQSPLGQMLLKLLMSLLFAGEQPQPVTEMPTFIFFTVGEDGLVHQIPKGNP
jgi:hypothetical protein